MMSNENKKIKPGEILVGKLEMHGKICEVKSAQPKEHYRPPPYKKGPEGPNGSTLPMIDGSQGAIPMYPQHTGIVSACEYPNASAAMMYPHSLHPAMMQMYLQSTHYGSPMYGSYMPPYSPEHYANTGFQPIMPPIYVAPVPFLPPVFPLAPVATPEQLDGTVCDYAPPILIPMLSPVQASVIQHAPPGNVMREEDSDVKLG